MHIVWCIDDADARWAEVWQKDTRLLSCSLESTISHESYYLLILSYIYHTCTSAKAINTPIPLPVFCSNIVYSWVKKFEYLVKEIFLMCLRVSSRSIWCTMWIYLHRNYTVYRDKVISSLILNFYVAIRR